MTKQNNNTDDKKIKSERIAKRIARAGLCSRRDAEKWILDARVSVNGVILDTPAFKTKPEDVIMVDDKLLPEKEETRIWRYYKPTGLVTTSRDEKDRHTIFDDLPNDLPRVITVGRLDMNTEGLLLLTNDGELARHLELPSTAWTRRYKVRVHGHVNEQALKNLKKGIEIDGMRYNSIDAYVEGKPEGREEGRRTNTWLSVTITEGKNREIRKVMEHLGLQVNRLIRLSYGPFQLGNLQKSGVEEIKKKALKASLGKGFEL